MSTTHNRSIIDSKVEYKKLSKEIDHNGETRIVTNKVYQEASKNNAKYMMSSFSVPYSLSINLYLIIKKL